MVHPDIILRFETVDGKTPDAENVVRALSAYIEILKASAEIIDPDLKPHVGLAGVQSGSDIFKFILRGCESVLETIDDGMQEYPRLKTAGLALGSLLATGVVAYSANVLAINHTSSDASAYSEGDAEPVIEDNRKLQRKRQQFYSILAEEPAYVAVEVINPYTEKVVVRVPRKEFADRSGLWDATDEVIEEGQGKFVIDKWTVTLIKPVLSGAKRRWGFARDGIEFSALMNDASMLNAIQNRTLPITLAEGIQMVVEIKYKEERIEDDWVPVSGSHQVTKVLKPLLPPPSSGPLFSDASPPKK